MRPIERLAQKLATNKGRTPVHQVPPSTFQLAVVTGVNGDGTINVTFDGNPNNDVSIGCLGTFIPQVGQTVFCGVLGTQPYAIGPTGGPRLYYRMQTLSPNPATIASGGSAVYTLGQFTLQAPALVRVTALIQASWPASQYQGFSVSPYIDGAITSNPGTASENSGTSVGTPSYAMSGYGAGVYAAGEHDLQVHVGIGGGGSTVTLSKVYAELTSY